MNYKAYLSKYIGQEGQVSNLYNTFYFRPGKNRSPVHKLVEVHDDFAIFHRVKKSTKFSVHIGRIVVADDI